MFHFRPVFVFGRKRKIRFRSVSTGRQRTGALYVQHNPTAASLSTSLSPEPCPNSPCSWTHWLQDLWSDTAAYEFQSKRIKKSSIWLNSHNALIQHLRDNYIFALPVLLVSAEAQVIWHGIKSDFWLFTCISNISAKKYENPFTCVKVIANQMWDVFWDMVFYGQLHYVLAPPVRN